MTQAELDSLRELYDRVNPGRLFRRGFSFRNDADPEYILGPGYGSILARGQAGGPIRCEDAAQLVCDAINAIPLLLDEIKRLSEIRHRGCDYGDDECKHSVCCWRTGNGQDPCHSSCSTCCFCQRERLA